MIEKEEINKIVNKISDQVNLNAKKINECYINRIRELFERSERKLVDKFINTMSLSSFKNIFDDVRADLNKSLD